MNDGMLIAVIDVIMVDSVDLDGGILGINLTFNETLLCLGSPNIEANLSTRTNHFKTEVFLYATGNPKRFGISENAVKGGKKLFCGKFLLVVVFRDF